MLCAQPVNRFRKGRSLKLAAVPDHHGNLRSARLAALRLDRLDDVRAALHLPEDGVSAIQPGREHGGDEELGAVGAVRPVSGREEDREYLLRPSIGHAEQEGLVVLELEVLVGELRGMFH